VEVRRLKNLENERRQLAEFEASAIGPKHAEKSNQGSEAGAIDVIHTGQLQDDSLFQMDDFIDLALENADLVSGDNPALAANNDYIFQDLALDG
jgi:hypothetical protein